MTDLLHELEPKSELPKPVVGPGEFRFAAAYADHTHLYGQTESLIQAGGELALLYDPDPARLQSLTTRFPGVPVARSFDEILDSDVRLVTAAAVPSRRGPLGCQVMKAGKDYFTDKTPFTTLAQVDEARAVCAETGRKYMVYYSERLNNEAAFYAGELVRGGLLGDVVHMEIFGPHRLNRASRPDWFFRKADYGGILTDIASHQFDQFLYYTGAKNGDILHALVDNRANPDTPELEDVGHAVLRLDTGATCFSKVNWFTPDGLRGWGDGRTFITGTRGIMELRKYMDLGRGAEKDLILVATKNGETALSVTGKVGFPFYGRFILDCLNRTEHAMTQEHAFKAAELAIQAQNLADRNRT